MYLTMLKSKIHQARTTQVELDYEGSIAIDRTLLETVGILPYEKVLVANLENGERLETYAIAAEPGSGTVCLNGAAAHKGRIGDRLIVFAFALVPAEEAALVRPTILRLDARNRPI